MEQLVYEIRPCSPLDLNKLMVLIEKHAEFEKAVFTKEGKQARLQTALFSEHAALNCIVVEVSGQVIGYATYTFDYSTWDAAWFIYLDCLYLEDDYRGYGIGQVLMEKVEEHGKTRGCVYMQWQTPDFNERAIKFYKRLGGIGKNKVRFTLPL
jgi:GNAT superfamily N-acetyltransferase